MELKFSPVPLDFKRKAVQLFSSQRSDGLSAFPKVRAALGNLAGPGRTGLVSLATVEV